MGELGEGEGGSQMTPKNRTSLCMFHYGKNQWKNYCCIWQHDNFLLRFTNLYLLMEILNLLKNVSKNVLCRISWHESWKHTASFALSFYRSQNVLGWSKFFMPNQKFIYILWQSQTFFARQKDDLHSVKFFFVPNKSCAFVSEFVSIFFNNRAINTYMITKQIHSNILL